METVVKELTEQALDQYQDLLDTLLVIETMRIDGDEKGVEWDDFCQSVHV